MWPFSRNSEYEVVTRDGTPPENRDIKGDWDAVLESILSQLKTHSGKTVNADSALYSSAVVGCVRVLAETLASLPLVIYKKRPDGGKDTADGHPLYPILHDSPHPMLSSFEFRELFMGHLSLRGNSYAFKEQNNAGLILSLTPLLPQNMTPEVAPDGKSKIYRYISGEGRPEVFKDSEIWHLKGLSTDGIIGLSPVSLAREAIGMALAAEDYGARFFNNDARPGGILTSPGKLQPDAAKRLKESVEEASTGANRHRLMVLEQGLDWKQVGLSQTDSQFLETRKLQIEEIARIYRVPCILIGHSNSTSTFASAEQFMLSFVIHTMRPWVVRWEQSINMHLLTASDRKQGYFAEFKLDALLRGDTASRYAAYSQAIASRIMNPNEVRALENMNPYDGGDEYKNPAIDKSQPDEKPKDISKDMNPDEGDNNAKQ
jgi:HK97 family phage portal protein